MSDTAVDIQIEIVRVDQLPRERHDYIIAWLVTHFRTEEGGTVWSDLDWHVLVWLDRELVSHVEIVDRVAKVDGQPIRLGGIGGVVTRPDLRSRGLGTQAMQAAQRWICREMGVDFGLLITGEDVLPFYQRLGWRRVKGPLVYDQPSGKVTFDGVVMVLPCHQETWPEGTIDLCGLPW